MTDGGLESGAEEIDEQDPRARKDVAHQSLWLGGYKDADGKIVTGFDNLKSYLGPDFELIEDKLMPFLIRENACENQWSVAHATIWKRRQATP
ncbi:hypothetical protein pdam_00015388 [Pocillopora damicornis]|uniref:Uncharacterized protein n=1 Tax=Pocillopora damicornis TaxID=46731 RepID=A0A3M6U3A8_POCDA|nr:hypothetical protein pdam_00015388 [Pocillopora damicornis]